MGETARKLHIVPSEDEEERFVDVIPIEIGKKIRKKAETTLKSGEMIRYLKEGNIYDAITVKLDIEDSIDDVTAIEGYEDAVKECMRITIENEMTDEEEEIDEGFAMELIVLKEDFGANIDFSSVERYEEIVKGIFFDHLDKGWIHDALEIKNNLGKGIDLSSIKGYDKAVERAFLHEINHYNIKEAINVIHDFGEGADLSKAIKKAFLILLRVGLPVEAVEFETAFSYDSELDKDMGLRDQKGYERAVQQGVNRCIREDDENAAVNMEHMFGEGKVTPLVRKKTPKSKRSRRRKIA